jgi:hypothetical protein
MGAIGWAIYHPSESDESKAPGSSSRSLTKLTDVFGDAIKPLLV